MLLDFLIEVMKSKRPELVSCYEDYKAEMSRLRGQAERGISETSSTSNSICSLYNQNGLGSSDEVIFKPNHRREASDTNSTSSLDFTPEADIRKRVITNPLISDKDL